MIFGPTRRLTRGALTLLGVVPVGPAQAAESSHFASVEVEALLSLAEVLEARGELEEAAALRETAAALEE